jgi:predicted transport protein
MRKDKHLPKPVFAHGQLYVAFSRARSFEDVKVKMNIKDWSMGKR